MARPPLDDFDLYVALATLTELEREMVWEVFWNGRTQADLAVERGVTREAVSRPFRCALKKLEGALGGA